MSLGESNSFIIPVISVRFATRDISELRTTFVPQTVQNVVGHRLAISKNGFIAQNVTEISEAKLVTNTTLKKNQIIMATSPVFVKELEGVPCGSIIKNVVFFSSGIRLQTINVVIMHVNFVGNRQKWKNTSVTCSPSSP